MGTEKDVVALHTQIPFTQLDYERPAGTVGRTGVEIAVYRALGTNFLVLQQLIALMDRLALKNEP